MRGSFVALVMTRFSARIRLRSQKPAFTLIEMLAVMAVIALLAALIVPAVFNARTTARRGACRGQLHGLGIAFRIYLNDHGGIMPVAAAMPSLALNDEPPIADALNPYVDDRRAFRCPADNARNYFETEGASYQYITTLGGKTVSDSFLSRRFGESKTPILHDYEPFHGSAGTPGSMNYLFGDLHVGDLSDFSSESGG
jgi:prepilin-type N-terminal cleavage/methylation domain-containing protein/prepilin-type processing-associated H-X9-DG protein